MHALFMINQIILTFLLVSVAACSGGVPEDPQTDCQPVVGADRGASTQKELESGKVSCQLGASPDFQFTLLGLPTNATGEQGPVASTCTCDGDSHYHCWGAANISCKSTLVVDEVVVTPTDAACLNPLWLGHGGTCGRDWVWCCQ